MALKKDYELENGIVCEYHTPIIMQNNRKETTIGISSFLNEEAYRSGKAPLRSRVDAIACDSKYPTPEEIYALITASRMSEVEEGEEAIETNFYADAEDC